MTHAEDRVAILESRCSRSAKELLDELKSHPQFSKLVIRLERLSGPIFKAHVEEAFLAVVKQPRD